MSANQFDLDVSDACNALPRLAVVPLVADDAVHRRSRAAHKRGVAAGGVCRHVNVIGVRKHRPAVQQSFEPVLAELVVESRQIIIAELVDHYADDQTDRLSGGRSIGGAAALLRGGGSGKEVSERESKTERAREARAIQQSCRHDLSLKASFEQ